MERMPAALGYEFLCDTSRNSLRYKTYGPTGPMYAALLKKWSADDVLWALRSGRSRLLDEMLHYLRYEARACTKKAIYHMQLEASSTTGKPKHTKKNTE
jgi:hypothetical protein